MNLVSELCMMTGLTDAMRSDFRVMQDVAKITRITPQARRDTIDKFIKRIKGNPEVNDPFYYLTVFIYRTRTEKK